MKQQRECTCLICNITFRGGWATKCKKCTNREKARKYKSKNRKLFNEKNREYYKANRDVLLEKKKEYLKKKKELEKVKKELEKAQIEIEKVKKERVINTKKEKAIKRRDNIYELLAIRYKKTKYKKIFLDRLNTLKKKYLYTRKNINLELNNLEIEILKSKEKREFKIIYLTENTNNVLIKGFDYLSMVEYFVCTKGFNRNKILSLFEKELKNKKPPTRYFEEGSYLYRKTKNV